MCEIADRILGITTAGRVNTIVFLMEKCLLISNLSLDRTMKLCCLSVINVKTMLQAFTFIFFQHQYQRTDATDISMFCLAPILPMSESAEL